LVRVKIRRCVLFEGRQILFGEPFHPQPEIDAVGLQVDTFDQEFDDAGLLCRE
jgi:hypothetical protein